MCQLDDQDGNNYLDLDSNTGHHFDAESANKGDWI